MERKQSTPSTTNRSNSENNVNINVGTSTNPQPFPAYQSSESQKLPYTPPNIMEQFVASVLAFKDDFPNFVRKLGYVLIIFMILTQVASSCYSFYLANSLEKRVIELERTAKDSYNVEREILDSIRAYNVFTVK